MTTAVHPIAFPSPAKRTRWLLFVVELIIAMNAYGGAWWGLTGAKDVPREWLEGTPFQSYVIPSLILLVFVGGGMTAAAAALLLHYRHAAEVSIAAGLILVGWITAQVLLIAPNGGLSWLQPTMFAAGLLVAGLGWRLRRGGIARQQGRASHADSG
jgi:hypothetical protein